MLASSSSPIPWLSGGQRLAWVLALAAGLVTLFVHGYRLSAAPDILSDELLYLLVGTNLARGAGLHGDTGFFFWHPPLYLLAEAAYIKLAGLLDEDILSALYSLRWLNASFSAGTAGLLLLLGHRLHSLKAGLLMAGIFLLDPYVQRINRRAMMETLALLFALVGLYIFFTRRPRLTGWQKFGAGLTFGLAALTKEVMALELLALLSFASWWRRDLLADALRVTAIAGASYLAYPLWAIAMGHSDGYFRYRLSGFARFFGLVKPLDGQPGGVDASPAGDRGPLSSIFLVLSQSILDPLLIALGALALVIFLLGIRGRLPLRYLAFFSMASCGAVGLGLIQRLLEGQFFFTLRTNSGALFLENVRLLVGEYATSYLLIGFGACATLMVLLGRGQRVEARYLATWSAVSYAFLGLSLAFGKLSDHFFYFLIAPAITMSGYTLATLLKPSAATVTAGRYRSGQVLRAPGWSVSVYHAPLRVVLPLLALLIMFSYDGYQWMDKYGQGADNSYAEIFRYVRENVPRGETIVAGSDVSNYLFLSDYDIKFYRSPRIINETQVHYFILSSKEPWGRYHGVTPEFYAWVMQQTRPLLEVEGRTFWRLGVYYREPSQARPGQGSG
jgi:4-amino-4-deoxy-L-arabinose transferase-like glycosyltransferase